ncbi:MAG: hypothetical protein KBG20_10530 [Caldilineaceae bacterium]|nr:hypothetical protein [Caldilineaceae bacterium]MBP8106391.1 hypothetical protein [Caldilineaceae bacterium]MBP8121426.1 hypothetical protein [Caldilineaceae bacterium]MBP9072728.1 hypothetical protein [Caldilineaceae bacterium]
MPSERISFLAFSRLVLDALDAAKLDYCIGGAVALWAWGEPRTTQDFDLVVHLPGNRIRLLSQELEKRRMLVPPDILLDLLIQPEGDLAVNAIHLDSGHKAELFLLRPNDPFRAAALERRRLVDLGDPLDQVYVHAPEDLILNKIVYYGLSKQSKHIRDIGSILLMSDDQIDWHYFDSWLDRLDLRRVWGEVKTEVDTLLG